MALPLIALIGKTVRVHFTDECPAVLGRHGDSEHNDGKVGSVWWIEEKDDHPICVRFSWGHNFYAPYELEAFDPASQEILKAHTIAAQDDDTRLKRVERRLTAP